MRCILLQEGPSGGVEERNGLATAGGIGFAPSQMPAGTGQSIGNTDIEIDNPGIETENG